MAQPISFPGKDPNIGLYYSRNASQNSQKNQNQDSNSITKELAGQTPSFNPRNYDSIPSAPPSGSDSPAATVEKFANNGWNVGRSAFQKNIPTSRTSSTVIPVSILLNSGVETGAAVNQTVGSSFNFVQTGVPNVNMNDLSAYNSLKAQDNANKLDLARPYNSITIAQAYGSDYLQAQTATYDSIYQALSDLRTQAAALQNPDLYNVNVASASAPDVASAVAGPNVPQAPLAINVEQLAQPEVLSSSVPTTTTTKTITTTTTTSMATPTEISATPSPNGGSLATGTHYFRVSTVDAAGHESAAAPEIIAVTGGNKGSVELSWAPDHNAKSYRVYIGSASGRETSYYNSNNATFKVTGSGNGVHAGRPLDTPDFFTTTETKTVTNTSDVAPNQSLGLSGTFSVNGWGVNVGAGDSLFDIATRVNSGSASPSGLAATAAISGSAKGNGRGNSKENNPATQGGLSAGTRYYRIAAVDASGNESAASPVVSATVGGNDNSVSLSWNKFSNANVYKIFFGDSAGNLNQYYSVDGSKTSFSDVGASATALSGSPTLDTSANFAFGFGTPQYTGASASVSGGRLLFTSQNGGRIAVHDPNGILQNLGMLYKNPVNGSVAVNTLNPDFQAAQSAIFTLNGARFTSQVNGPFQVGGYTLNLTGAGATTITAAQDPAAAEQSVQNFVQSYNQAMETLNRAVMNGGAIAQNLKLQEIYSDVVRFLNSPPPARLNGTGSLSDVGVGQSDGQPTSVQETVLQQLANKETANNSTNSITAYFPAGQGPLSLLNKTGGIGVNSPDNFKLTLDSGALKNALLKNPVGTGEMLDYAASRLQGRLDVHLQPGYGTLAFQRKVMEYYANNQGLVSSLMAGAQGISTNRLNSRNIKTLISSI